MRASEKKKREIESKEQKLVSHPEFFLINLISFEIYITETSAVPPNLFERKQKKNRMKKRNIFG